MARGSLGTVREGIQRAQRELSHANFRKIDERHRMQQIEWKTTEMVTSDLEKYYKVQPARLCSVPYSSMSATLTSSKEHEQHLRYAIIISQTSQDVTWHVRR